MKIHRTWDNRFDHFQCPVYAIFWNNCTLFCDKLLNSIEGPGLEQCNAPNLLKFGASELEHGSAHEVLQKVELKADLMVIAHKVRQHQHALVRQWYVGEEMEDYLCQLISELLRAHDLFAYKAKFGDWARKYIEKVERNAGTNIFAAWTLSHFLYQNNQLCCHLVESSETLHSSLWPTILSTDSASRKGLDRRVLFFNGLVIVTGILMAVGGRKERPHQMVRTRYVMDDNIGQPMSLRDAYRSGRYCGVFGYSTTDYQSCPGQDIHSGIILSNIPSKFSSEVSALTMQFRKGFTNNNMVMQYFLQAIWHRWAYSPSEKGPLLMWGNILESVD
ncbi:hypothetical protein BT69DRAFT_1292346 [Atractiella rhizophila]|nr:hypothetical protein BT69DRAFT_1292346 [Atractiella rhizophila]